MLRYLPSAGRVAELIVCLLAIYPAIGATQEPAQSPENTIRLEMIDPVAPQTFSRPLKFLVSEVIDRSGNAQPLVVVKGIFLDREPVQIVREFIEGSLKATQALAANQESADLLLRVFIFHFGIAGGSLSGIQTKVEFNVTVRDAHSNRSQTVTAMGTAIESGAKRKKNQIKNLKANLESSLRDAVRNLLRGVQLKNAVETLSGGTSSQP